MRSSVKLGVALAAAAAVSLLHAQNAVLDPQSEGHRSSGVMQFNPKELTIKKDVPAAQPLSLTPLDRPIAREPGKLEVPNVQAVRPVTPRPAPAAGGWPAKIQGPTMVDKSGEARRAPAKIDAITIKQGVVR